MRRRGRSSAGRWGLGAVLIVALVGGVAWAETQAVATLPGQGATVVAVLVPGAAGAEVCGDEKGQEHVLFNIGGQVEVGGEVAVNYVADDTYTVTLVFRMEAGLWAVDTTIENGAGEAVFMQMGHPVHGGMPGMVFATGARVISLTAE